MMRLDVVNAFQVGSAAQYNCLSSDSSPYCEFPWHCQLACESCMKEVHVAFVSSACCVLLQPLTNWVDAAIPSTSSSLLHTVAIE